MDWVGDLNPRPKLQPFLRQLFRTSSPKSRDVERKHVGSNPALFILLKVASHEEVTTTSITILVIAVALELLPLMSDNCLEQAQNATEYNA